MPTPRHRRWFKRRNAEQEPIGRYTNALQDMYFFVKDVEADVEEKLKKEKEKEDKKKDDKPKEKMYNATQLFMLSIVWGLISGFAMYYFVLSNLVPGK